MPRHTPQSPTLNSEATRQYLKQTTRKPIDALLGRLDDLFRHNYDREIPARKVPGNVLRSLLQDNQRGLKRMGRVGTEPSRRSRWLRARLAIAYALSAPEFPYMVSDIERRIVRNVNPEYRSVVTAKLPTSRAFEIADPRVTFWVKALFPEVSRQTASRYSIIITYFKARSKRLLPSKVYRKLGYHSLHGLQGIARRVLTAHKG